VPIAYRCDRGRRGSSIIRPSVPPIPLSTLSLVIPAFNEEARLPALLETLATSADEAARSAGFELLEVVLVDDGSTDATRRMLDDAGAADPRLKPLLGSGENRGKGAAIATGVAAVRGEYVLLADVDLSTPLEELPKLATALGEGADVAIGSRGLPGSEVERGPAHRQLTGSTFSAVVRAMTGLRLRDTQNGFKLLPAELAKGLFADQLCPGFAFDVELLLRAQLEGLRIAEVPVLYIHDSRSSVRVASASLRMLREVTVLSRKLRPRARRLHAPAGQPGIVRRP
jgi:dolichyl-phosphate beta-glucosyltransferase